MQVTQFGNHNDYLSRDNTNCLKGILAISVLAHHLYQHSGLLRSGWLRLIGGCFQALGYLSVALFFFLSGYGLTASYSKNPTSINHFVKYKILPFYVINVILVAIYCCSNYFLWKSLSAAYIIKSLTFGGTVILNGWYLQVQLLYYIMFYFVFRFFKKKWQIPLMIILQTTYTVICILCGLHSIYYERTLIFVVGILWYENQDKIDSWLDNKKYRWLITWIMSCVLFAITYLLSYCAMEVVFRGISYFFLIPAVILMLKKTNIKNNVTLFLGKLSLEIFAVQGIFLFLFHDERLYISNPYLYIVVVTISTMVSACMLHPLFHSVYRLFRSSDKERT